jgi:hypothetical protein
LTLPPAALPRILARTAYGGYKNQADFGVRVGHRNDNGTSLTLSNTDLQQVKLTMTDGRWLPEIVDNYF